MKSNKSRRHDIDPRDMSAYGIAEAARYLRIASATLRSWVAGRSYPRQDEEDFFPPLIQPVNVMPVTLSFNNLIEAHVLRALRIDHGVSIEAVRKAIRYANRKGLSTQTIVERIDTEEELEFVARDYSLSIEEIEMAVLYERAA